LGVGSKFARQPVEQLRGVGGTPALPKFAASADPGAEVVLPDEVGPSTRAVSGWSLCVTHFENARADRSDSRRARPASLAAISRR